MRRFLTIFVVGAIASLSVFAKPDGTCGYECTEDAACSGCGSAGKCSCPNGNNVSFFEIGCTCVSAPAGAPTSPPVDIGDSVWPQQFTADVEAWCYRDWGHTAVTAKGKFYYDMTRGKTRADWSPYISGKDAGQVWITSMSDKPESTYYVKTGPVCISFHITDPGQNKKMVGIEKPNWMQACKDAGLATYVGREQIDVDGQATWVDHWSCRLDYKAANQSITFQNWNTIGLGGMSKGLPIRVTGGNSAPDPQKGSPRLNTVWYNQFDVGSNSTKDDDFKPPNWGIFCIPVGASETEAFFGHPVEPEHVFSPTFQRRAHHLPHAKASPSDLIRAKRPKPGRAFTGDSFGETMQKLNAVLTREAGLTTKHCGNFTLPELHETQRTLFDARTPELDDVYRRAKDTRKISHATAESLEAAQARHAKLESERPDLAAKTRDGVCHEAVMWYIHHLSSSARAEIKERLVLPLLPMMEHPEPPASADVDSIETHNCYNGQVSCAICHVTPSVDSVAITV